MSHDNASPSRIINTRDLRAGMQYMDGSGNVITYDRVIFPAKGSRGHGAQIRCECSCGEYRFVDYKPLGGNTEIMR